MANSAGGGAQLNSGRTWFSKRDSRKFNFLVENRLVVEAKQYIIKGTELPKLTQDAFFHHQLPAMNIEFEKLRENWMLIRTLDFEEMIQRLAELEHAVVELSVENRELENSLLHQEADSE